MFARMAWWNPLFEAAAGLDALAGSHHPPAFRCPNGAFADLIEVFNGRPLYDPGTIEAPVLLVRGERDTTSTAWICDGWKRRLDRLEKPVWKYLTVLISFVSRRTT